MQLKPQDVVVLIKLLEYGERGPPYAQITEELYLSASEVHAAVQRARRARLLGPSESVEVPNKSAVEEFLLHGVNTLSRLTEVRLPEEFPPDMPPNLSRVAFRRVMILPRSGPPPKARPVGTRSPRSTKPFSEQHCGIVIFMKFLL